MIKSILIDDEHPALCELDAQLKKYPDITVLGMYTDPFEALKKIEKFLPDTVFLDISMPQLHGMDVASMIQKKSPETKIVFVTAFDGYAVEAFDLYALDYLLKPVESDRLQKTITRLRQSIKSEVIKSGSRQNIDDTLRIRCFGRFEIGYASREPIRWRTEKTKELFAYLLHNAQHSISKNKILDALWQDKDYYIATRQLYNGIYYIRKALAEYCVSRSEITIDRNYSLRICDADYDVVRFCQLYHQKENRLQALEEMETLYTGDYLADLPYDWSVNEQEMLLMMYMRSMIELSKQYVIDKRNEDAISVLLKAYNHNPFDQAVTEFLLSLYREMGNKTAAVRHYNAYKQLLKAELNISPDKHIRGLVN